MAHIQSCDYIYSGTTPCIDTECRVLVLELFRNNTEEGILLLMILLRIMNKEQGYFDASVFEHLAFALSTNGQMETLAHQYEALLPGTLARPDRWYSLALCYAGSNPTRALALLRKSLAATERPNDVPALILAAKLCVVTNQAELSVGYAKRAVANLEEGSVGFKARALHVHGVAARSLPALQEAAALDGGDCSIIFDLGLALAEQKRTGNRHCILLLVKKKKITLMSFLCKP